MVSVVESNISYLSLVTIEGDQKDSCDESWCCVLGIICVSGIIVISSVVGLLRFWFCFGFGFYLSFVVVGN